MKAEIRVMISCMTLFVLMACTKSAQVIKGDAEPVDPNEQRPTVMPPDITTLPPQRLIVSPALLVTDRVWQNRGPAPTSQAQLVVPPNHEVSGAIQSIAAHPDNADIVCIGAVNGGVWRTSNATSVSPTWVPLTESMPSQSIADVVFDPTDASHQTIVVGTGRWSNFAQRGDDEVGLYRSTNSGDNWTQLGATAFLGQKIVSVVARGPIILVATTSGGLFKSIDTGANFSSISGSNGLPAGGIGAFVDDRNNPNRVLVGVRGTTPKVLRSDDLGATWTDVTTGLANLSATSLITNFRLGLGPDNTAWAAVINSGVLNGLYRSGDLGVTWTALDTPAIHPGRQGNTNTSLLPDRNNSNWVYLGGDRSASNLGNIVRVDAGQTLGMQITSLVGSAGASVSAPHSDSRDMAFDSNGNILEADDGGIYRLMTPLLTTRKWFSVVGNLNVMEVHNVAADTLTGVLMIGTQDNGTHQQSTAGALNWTWFSGGDGGDVLIDNATLGAAGSYRYFSSQNLLNFRRRQFDASNAQPIEVGFGANLIPDPQFVTPLELNTISPRRLLIGGVNNLYEYADATLDAPGSPVTLGAPGANRQAMSYGAVDDPDGFYVGKNSQVFRRIGAAGAINATASLPAGAQTITDVVMDPDNSLRVFAVDDNQVFRSVDGGASWTDITGNLGVVSAEDFRTVEYLPDSNTDLIAIGTRSGVYVAAANGNVWSRAGTALPDVLVFDLEYLRSSKTLIAGTLGRGVWSLDLDSGEIFADGFE